MYKNIKTGETISQDTYESLPYSKKNEFYRTNTQQSQPSGDFGLSMAIGMATDSALLGAVVGGDIAGGIIGDLLGGGGLMD